MKLKMLWAVAALCGAVFGGAEVPLWPEGKMPSPQKGQCKPFLVWHEPKEVKSIRTWAAA